MARASTTNAKTTRTTAASSRSAAKAAPARTTPAQTTTGPRAPSGDRCACGEHIVRIDLLIDGDEITMESCSNCDRRSWHRGGEQVELEGVLADLSSVPTRYRRDLANR